METVFAVGQKITISLDGSAKKYTYEGFEEHSELHKLKADESIVYLDDDYLQRLILESKRAILGKSINNLFDIFSIKVG